MLKKCPKCGKDREARGFVKHIEYCKGKLLEKSSENQPSKAADKVLKELPGAAAQAGMLAGLNRERELVKQRTKEPDDNKKVIECPSCRCIDVEVKGGYLDPCQEYRCGMCGFIYQVNTVTGDYIYE